MVQIIILAGVALFLILKLRNALGTREGFEKPRELEDRQPQRSSENRFEVIDGGGEDYDIAHHVDPNSAAGKALSDMKRVDSEFNLEDFTHGARSAYEMIVMAYENGDLDTLRDYLAADVYGDFEAAIEDRRAKGYVVEAEFAGVREVTVQDAHFDPATQEGDITVRFTGELSSVVRNSEGEIVEGVVDELKQQKDVWTFSRVLTSDNPNWLLTGTVG